MENGLGAPRVVSRLPMRLCRDVSYKLGTGRAMARIALMCRMAGLVMVSHRGGTVVHRFAMVAGIAKVSCRRGPVVHRYAVVAWIAVMSRRGGTVVHRYAMVAGSSRVC